MAEEEHKGEEHQGFRNLVRRLKRGQAPWYFEAELQQRLARGAQRFPPALRSVPAYALPISAFVVLGVVGYYFLSPGSTSPDIEKSSTDSLYREIQPARPLRSPSEHNIPSVGRVHVETLETDSRGPSDQRSEQAIETGVLEVPSRVLELDTPPPQEPAYQFELDVRPQPLTVDTLILRESASDSTDSLQAKKDSVKRN